MMPIVLVGWCAHLDKTISVTILSYGNHIVWAGVNNVIGMSAPGHHHKGIAPWTFEERVYFVKVIGRINITFPALILFTAVALHFFVNSRITS